MDKLYYSIKEIAEMCSINPSALRYWEKLGFISPHKTEKGTRLYREKDIENIRRIHYWTKEQGLTLDGVKRKLKDDKETAINTEEIVFRLRTVRDELLKLKDEFDDTGIFTS
jgi:DNA-binding transcriptional MerR regulator